jgi:hypothetical protein
MSDQATKLPAVRQDGLQLEEHRSFQERFWTTERWAWIGFGTILVLALLGLTGSGGPFAQARTSLAGGSIDYPRFARWDAPAEIRVTFAPGGSERTLMFSSSFATSFEIEGIQPEPERAEANAEGQVMTFRAAADGPAEVSLHIRPRQPGVAAYRVGIDDGAPLAASTFVWP